MTMEILILFILSLEMILQCKLKEALWVRKRANSSSPMATTWIDHQLFRNGDDHDTIGMIDYADPDDIPFSILGGGI